jgi:hypothetical protein
VVDPRQAPLAGIPIGSVDSSSSGIEASGRASGADGRFEVPLPSPSSNPRPVALAPGRAALACELADGEWLLVLSDTAAYSGVVVDESGTPLAGVELWIEARREYLREHGYLRPMDGGQPTWRTKSDSLGRFSLPAAPAGATVEVHAILAGFLGASVQVPPGGAGHATPCAEPRA